MKAQTVGYDTQQYVEKMVIAYLARNCAELESMLPHSHYFRIRGQTVNEQQSAPSRFVFGTALDVLADLLENDQFFGWALSGTIDQVGRPSNAHIQVVTLQDDSLEALAQVTVTEDGSIALGKRVSQKEYLNHLRTQEGLQRSLGSLILQEGEKRTPAIFGRPLTQQDAEEIATTLYC